MIPTPEEMNKGLLTLMRGVNAQAFQALGNKVLGGPFEGMQIPEQPPWDDGNASTKLLGCYEFELHPTIEKALSRHPRAIVNIGCAEGYYAIGLAMIAPARVFAFDLDLRSLAVCAEYARINGVAGKVETFEGCRQAAEMAYGRNHLYLMDCESAELELLDKKACPSLIKSDIIVECHDFMDPTISATLVNRFSDTHQVEIILPKLPRLDDFPFASSSPSVMTLLAVTEKRPMPTLWLACWAN